MEGRINALLEILPSINADVNLLSGESQKLLDQLDIQISFTPPPEVEVEENVDDGTDNISQQDDATNAE